MRSFLLLASIALPHVSGIALDSEVVTGDDHIDEHLQLLQVSARRHQQDAELIPEDSQGPYQVLGPNTQCPDDQVLTLRQCAEAIWSGAVPNVHMPYQSYGAMNAKRGPRGCWYAMGNRGVYYNPFPTGSPDGRLKPICSRNGGRVAQKQEEAALPAEGVEHLPVNTECQCGTLTMDQCKLAGESLGVISPQNKASMGGYPIFTSFQNPKSDRRDQQPAPYGCFTVTRHQTILYWNMDQPGDTYKSSPHHMRRPICPVCPTTTTTTPAPPPPVEEVVPGDQAEAIGDPHITSNTGRQFDLE